MLNNVRKCPAPSISECLLQIFWNTTEEVQHQNHQERIYRTWQNKYPEGIHQTNLLNHNVKWNQSAVEHHTENEQPRVDITSTLKAEFSLDNG